MPWLRQGLLSQGDGVEDTEVGCVVGCGVGCENAAMQYDNKTGKKEKSHPVTITRRKESEMKTLLMTTV